MKKTEILTLISKSAQHQSISYSLTQNHIKIISSWEQRKWSPIEQAFGCWINSPCRHFRKCRGCKGLTIQYLSVNSSLPMMCNWWWVARSTSWVQRSTSLHPWFCTWISFASSCCFWQYLVVEATKQCQQYLTILRVCPKHFINGNPPWSNCSNIFLAHMIICNMCICASEIWNIVIIMLSIVEVGMNPQLACIDTFCISTSFTSNFKWFSMNNFFVSDNA